MTEEAIRSFVERHWCQVFATRYSIRLKWVAAEPCSNPEWTRYLLQVELTAAETAPAAPIQMNLSVPLTRLSEFPAALDHTLRVSLYEETLQSGPQRPWTSRMQRWADAVRPVGRWPWGLTMH